MTWQIRITKDAEEDIREALAWTWEQFGERKFQEYRSLIREALFEIADNPFHVRSRQRPEIHPKALTCHLSRRGKHARHFFLYRVTDDRVVEVDRLLYDGMELNRHLPGNYEL